ncbi:MAG TPA: ornithine carbamoyltransferase [Polyangiaceae bacterium]|jgi:ornithine carbamoyltransferase|nr:ornithine carbamoyltransferase [Polyangiaceae bacterium]
MMHLLKTTDLTAGDLSYLLRRSAKFKSKPLGRRSVLSGETVCCYFAKPSTRTRISFETAVVHLGGTPLFLGPNDLQLGRGETLEDTARIISRYSRALVIRTFADEHVERLARAATIPVINALTDGHHPCQSVADLLTVTERKGALDRLKFTYLGDGNNVAVSLTQAVALAGGTMALGCPAGYGMPAGVVEEARALADRHGGKVIVTEDPAEALRNADVVYTDVWLSMGHAESERAERHRALAPYQVNAAAMRLAKSDALFLHCLPAHRGEEVTADVCDGPQSVIFDQAENRLWTSMAILYGLLEGKLEGSPSAVR